ILTVGKVAQSITFAPLTDRTFGDAPFALSGTASSGLAVAYASSNTAVATVSESTVTVVGAGTTAITASQEGSADYHAATPVSHTLNVGKASQTLTFAPLAVKTYGDAEFALGATATSGLTVAYTSSDTTVAKVTGSTIAVIGSGSVVITASQAGNS